MQDDEVRIPEFFADVICTCSLSRLRRNVHLRNDRSVRSALLGYFSEMTI